MKQFDQSRTTREEIGNINEEHMLSDDEDECYRRQTPERSIESSFERAEVTELSCPVPTASESISHVVIVAQIRSTGSTSPGPAHKYCASPRLEPSEPGRNLAD